MEVKIIDYSIQGAVTHYLERKWIVSKGCIEGGYYRKVKRKYDIPKVNVSFRAQVDMKLDINSVYIDGVNKFLAINENEIVNLEPEVITFSIPNKLQLISSLYKEIVQQ
jgi:hypothetical protein